MIEVAPVRLIGDDPIYEVLPAVLEWQVVDGISDGSLISERPHASPNPAVEVRQLLADGTEIKAVWSFLIAADVAKLVTVRFFDE